MTATAPDLNAWMQRLTGADLNAEARALLGAAPKAPRLVICVPNGKGGWMYCQAPTAAYVAQTRIWYVDGDELTRIFDAKPALHGRSNLGHYLHRAGWQIDQLMTTRGNRLDDNTDPRQLVFVRPCR